MATIKSRCSNCQSLYEVKRITDTNEVPVTFCTFCGQSTIVTGEEEGDYWTTIAADIGLPRNDKCALIVRRMFDEWSPSTGDPIRFIDFAREWVAETPLG